MLNSSVTFPGLNTITGARFTLSRGVFPGKGTITMLPQDVLTVAPGEFAWNSDVDSLSFPRCTLDIAHLRKRETPLGWRWDVNVFDRRYYWWKYTIDGDYNRRRGDGQLLVSSKKSARQLARIILDIVNEPDADVSGMPDDVYPRCKWVAANAAVALQWLCEYCSTAIGFDIGGAVKLTAYGEGADLPTIFRVNPSWKFGLAKPSALLAVSGPTVYQSRLALTPVMLDEDDDTMRSVSDVGYKPTNDWTYEPWTNFGNVGDEFRFHANREFCQWWQPYAQANGGLAVPGSDTVISSIQQILPLLPDLASVIVNGGDELEFTWPYPYSLRGDFWPLSDVPVNAVDQEWIGQFWVHLRTGLTKTEYPVFVINEGSPNPLDTVKLYLTAAYNVRNADGELDRLKESQSLGGETGVHVLVRPEVFGSRIQLYGDNNAPGEVRDTREAARTELKAYLTQFAKRYVTGLCDVAEVAGFQRCPLDGKIAQIALQYALGQYPRMVASSGYEHDVFNESFEQTNRKVTLQRVAEQLANEAEAA